MKEIGQAGIYLILIMILIKCFSRKRAKAASSDSACFKVHKEEGME